MRRIHSTIGALALMLLAAVAICTFLVAAGTIDHRFPPWIPAPPADQPVLEPELSRADQSYRPLEAELNAIESMQRPARVATAVLALVAALAAGALLLSPGLSRRQRPTLLVADDERGVATIAWASVQGLAEAAAMANPQVLDVRCHVRNKPKTPPAGPDRITVRCTPLLRPNAPFPQVRADLEHSIRGALEHGTGLVVERINVTTARFGRLPKDQMLDISDTRTGAQ